MISSDRVDSIQKMRMKELKFVGKDKVTLAKLQTRFGNVPATCVM
jgi:hypothetical protein